LVPRALKSVAAQLFKALLEYTGVLSCGSQVARLHQIVNAIREHSRYLVDEFYFQLIKQTTNNRNSGFLLKTWEVFLIVASIFPPSGDYYPWIRAHIARATTDADVRVADLAAFVLIRFETRHHIGRILDYRDRHYIERIPGHPKKGRASFGVILYEMMFCQRAAFPRLPIPFALHYIISLLKQRNATRTPGIFQNQANEALVAELLADANDDIEVISRGDVNVIATILKRWVADLVDPIVPSEMADVFVQMCDQGRLLGFVEHLPQVHRMTLTYLVGFLQEVVANAQVNGMDIHDLAVVFGPLVVRPAKSPSLAQRLTQASIVFFERLLGARDSSLVYPLNPAYLLQRP
jgi:hypothetical protein